MTLQEVRNMVATRLKEAGIESYEYESRIFLEWKLGISHADYYMNPNREVEEDALSHLMTDLVRRENREPLQYLIGSCNFMGYDFYVDERVLIPRQDTEWLVDQAQHFLEDRIALGKILSQNTPIRVLDLCTGSGCIGISLKLLCKEVEVVLSDLSADALSVAEKNAADLGAEVTIIQGDLFESLLALPEEERSFDLIISNPPYIPTRVVEGLMPEVKDHEPRMALDGTEDGLYFYKRITKESVKYMKKNAALMYEIGAEQGESVSALLRQEGFEDVSVRKDLAGLDRIVRGRLS